jgi:hypothetical protein
MCLIEQFQSPKPRHLILLSEPEILKMQSRNKPQPIYFHVSDQRDCPKINLTN